MILKSFENCKISRIFSVIFWLVPKILVQQVTNLVNKFAILLKRSMFRQDCRNASGNDGCWGCVFNTCCNVFNASSINVMLACEHSELPRASRNIMAILLNRMYHPEHSANSLRSKPSVTGNCVGRSMIEMLGVLAIIAVLSVGGIAGYSKAMQMYKLNKWKSDFVMMTANLKTAFINSRSYSEVEETDLTNFFKDLNIVPQNFLTSYNKDIFGNTIKIYVRENPNIGINYTHVTIQVMTLPNQDSVKQCISLFEMIKEYDDAWFTILNEDTSYPRYAICGKSAPALFAKYEQCVLFDISEVAAKCAVCAKQICNVKFCLSNGY